MRFNISEEYVFVCQMYVKISSEIAQVFFNKFLFIGVSSTRDSGCRPSQKPRQQRSEECYISYATAAVPIFDHVFFALPRGVPVTNCFNGLLRALMKNSLENRMSKFHLVKKWWYFENCDFGVQHPFCCCYPRHVSPDFFRRSPYRRLMKLGIRILYTPSIVTFWFLPKNLKKKISPLPHNFEFFWVPPIFFDVPIIVG